MSQRSHSASALTCSPLGLEGPIIASYLARWVASRGASLLLLVPILLAAVATERMRLVAAFSLSLSSLRLYISNTHQCMRAEYYGRIARGSTKWMGHDALSLPIAASSENQSIKHLNLPLCHSPNK